MHRLTDNDPPHGPRPPVRPAVPTGTTCRRTRLPHRTPHHSLYSVSLPLTCPVPTTRTANTLPVKRPRRSTTHGRGRRIPVRRQHTRQQFLRQVPH
eukprot:38404-Eustigmatos_ZCMA.PRE.1